MQNYDAKQYKRGDIVYVDFGEPIGSVQGGIRPALILQNNMGNLHSPTLLVAPLTGAMKKLLPVHMHIGLDIYGTGLKKESTVLFEQCRVIDKKIQIKSRIGHVKLGLLADMCIIIAFGCSIISSGFPSNQADEQNNNIEKICV